MSENHIEDSPLKCLYWREEILQLMYWMQGEGMGSEVAPTAMLPFLQSHKANIEFHLEKMTKDGYLECTPGGKYCLSPMGIKEGGKQFAEAFQGMQKAGHGECGPDCEFCYGPDGSKLENCVHNCATGE